MVNIFLSVTPFKTINLLFLAAFIKSCAEKKMLSWKHIIFLISIIFGVSFPSMANVAFFHYGIDKGLPEARIVSISQDSTGFIWLAGESSLYRFDGVRFRNYQNTGSGSAESFFGEILTLFTDSQGTLWVGSSNGLAYYDFRGDVFIRIKNGWSKEDVHDIAEDSGGNLWMATNSGIAGLKVETMETVWYTGETLVKPSS